MIGTFASKSIGQIALGIIGEGVVIGHHGR
jgi:hypothetical protein